MFHRRAVGSGLVERRSRAESQGSRTTGANMTAKEIHEVWQKARRSIDESREALAAKVRADAARCVDCDARAPAEWRCVDCAKRVRQ